MQLPGTGSIQDDKTRSPQRFPLGLCNSQVRLLPSFIQVVSKNSLIATKSKELPPQTAAAPPSGTHSVPAQAKSQTVPQEP